MALLLPSSVRSQLVLGDVPALKGDGPLKQQIVTPATSFGSEATCPQPLEQEEEEDWDFDCYAPCQAIPEEEPLDKVSELETEEARCDVEAKDVSVPTLAWVVRAPERSVDLKRSGRLERLLEELRSDALAAQSILQELSGSFRKFAYSRVGSRLLEALLARLPQGCAGALIDEMLGDVAEASSHRYASRVLCAVLEHHCTEDCMDVTTEVFLEELLHAIPELVRDTFGHRVVLRLLERSDAVRRRVVAALRRDCEGLMMHALDENASAVVAAALSSAPEADREMMAEDLLEEHPSMLAVGAPGCRVLRSLLLHTNRCEEVAEQLQEAEELLLMSKQGRRLANDFGIVDAMWVA